MVACQDPSSASAFSLFYSHWDLTHMCVGKEGEVEGETTTRAPPNCDRCGDSAIERKGGQEGGLRSWG